MDTLRSIGRAFSPLSTPPSSLRRSSRLSTSPAEFPSSPPWHEHHLSVITDTDNDLITIDQQRLADVLQRPGNNYEIALKNYDRPPPKPLEACICGIAPESIMYETPECIVDQATVELDPEYRAALVLPPLKFNSGLAKIIYIEDHLEHAAPFKDLHLLRLRKVEWVDQYIARVGIQVHSNGRRNGWVLVEDEINIKHLLMLLFSKVPVRAWTLQKTEWEEGGCQGYEGVIMWMAEK